MGVKVNERNEGTAEKPKNKRGLSVFLDFSVSEEEVKQARFDILADRKLNASHSLGEHIFNELEIFKQVEPNEGVTDVHRLQARLVVINEDDYKQMVKLINTALNDVGTDNVTQKRVLELLTGIIG